MPEQTPANLQESSQDLANKEARTYLQAIPIGSGRALNQSSPAKLTAEFPSPGSKKMDGEIPIALQYPGKRPDGSFSISGNQVALGKLLESVPVKTSLNSEKGLAFYVNVRGEDGHELVWNINDLLENTGAIKLEDRIPVVTFGSNANPGQLAQKFENLEGADKYIVPTLKANLKGMAPVYVARIGINGYTFTDLAPTNNPEARSEVYVNFFSKSQLEAVNATEGAYSLCEVPNVTIDTEDGEGVKLPAYLYVGRADSKAADILTDEQGKPIRLSELETIGEGVDEQFAAMSQPEVQQYIAKIARDGVAAKLGIAPETLAGEYDLVGIVINRNRDERLAKFKAGLSPEDSKRLGGILTQQVIQKTIKETGRTAVGRNIRDRIPKSNQDKTIDDVKTFAQLMKETEIGTQ